MNEPILKQDDSYHMTCMPTHGPYGTVPTYLPTYLPALPSGDKQTTLSNDGPRATRRIDRYDYAEMTTEVFPPPAASTLDQTVGYVRLYVWMDGWMDGLYAPGEQTLAVWVDPIVSMNTPNIASHHQLAKIEHRRPQTMEHGAWSTRPHHGAWSK